MDKGIPPQMTTSNVPCGYICGRCGSETEIRSEDAIRCRVCDYRILYKKRVRQPIQYEAR